EGDADRVADAVPVDRHGADLEGDRVRRDRNQGEHRDDGREDGQQGDGAQRTARARMRAGSVILGRDARSSHAPAERPPMSAEFNWWLLIVGVVAGAARTWLVVADSTRREREVGERELPAEAAWIARSVARPAVDADTAERVLRAHRRYLGFPPPDVLV